MRPTRGSVFAVAAFYLPQRDLTRIREIGLAARATAIDILETGASRWMYEGTRRQVRCELEVRLPDDAPRRARAVRFVGEATEKELRRGATVAVRVDPHALKLVAIDEPLSRAA